MQGHAREMYCFSNDGKSYICKIPFTVCQCRLAQHCLELLSPSRKRLCCVRSLLWTLSIPLCSDTAVLTFVQFSFPQEALCLPAPVVVSVAQYLIALSRISRCRDELSHRVPCIHLQALHKENSNLAERILHCSKLTFSVSPATFLVEAASSLLWASCSRLISSIQLIFIVECRRHSSADIVLLITTRCALRPGCVTTLVGMSLEDNGPRSMGLLCDCTSEGLLHNGGPSDCYCSWHYVVPCMVCETAPAANTLFADTWTKRTLHLWAP